MKSLILLCVAAIFATTAVAQSLTATSVKPGVMKRAGSVWIVKPMQDNKTMDNGVTVKPNGYVNTPDGKIIPLNNGDCIGASGKIIGLNEKDVNYALVKNGKMWIVTRLNQTIVLKDGSSISPDGTLKKTNGTIIALKNNQVVSFDGTPSNNNTSADASGGN